MQIFYRDHTGEETAKKFNVSRPTVVKYCVGKKNKISPEERRYKKTIFMRNKRNSFKERAVKYKGNKCEHCGYSKCLAALEFHHKDPEKKEFGISSANRNRSWKQIKIELKKCLLLCSNCHREIHDNMLG